MKFSEAMDSLREGKKVTRELWKDGVYFLMVEGSVKSFQPKLVPYVYNEDIMVSDGWIVNGEKGEFKFADIVQFLLEGRQAALKDWREMYVAFDRQTKSLVVHSMDVWPFIPDFESFIAHDWIEL